MTTSQLKLLEDVYALEGDLKPRAYLLLLLLP
jgi:hypothetical protein